MLYKGNLLTLRTMGYIVSMCILYCLWAQVAVLDRYIAYIGLLGQVYAGTVFG